MAKIPLWWLVLLIGAVLVVPWVVAGELFYLDIIALTLIWTLGGVAWNLVGGYQRQLALGHSAFFAIGAYTSTLLYLNFHISPWLGMLLGALLGALMSAAVAALCFRLKGAFYALATFALAQVFQIVLISWHTVTGGSDGLAIPYQPDPKNMIFTSTTAYIYLIGLICVAAVGITAALARSRWGLVSLALNSDETAARALGVHVFSIKVQAAALSGAITAVAGTLYAQYLLYIYPGSVAGVDYSIQIALIAVLGGSATALGPLVGAAILIPASAFLTATLGSGDFATNVPGLKWIVYGTMLVLVLLFIPEGVGPRVANIVKQTIARLPLIVTGRRSN